MDVLWRRWGGLFAWTLLALGCKEATRSPAETPPPPPALRADAAMGPLASSGPADAAPLLARFECHRCHDGTGLPDIGPEKHCVRCHQDILNGTFAAEPEALADWQRSIHSLVKVPSLDSIGQRLTRAWVRAHLLEPMDVRPALFASMPRLDMAEAEAEAMAAYLVPREAAPAAFSAQQASRGRDLYEQLGCASCHAFTGVRQRVRDGRYSTAPGAERTIEPAPAAIELAPDLAWTRSRFQSGRLVAWIADAPRAKPGTLMPGLALSHDQASALAAFIMTTPLPERSQSEVPERLPVLDREVGYDEVATRVFRKVCWHCHASPDYARGDGGPGMSGGFGFAGRGLDLSSYTGVAAGSIGPDGRRRSVFSPVHEGTPRLVAHLWARHAEEAGRPIFGIRGMPLGLPALPLEDIQLVESWIAQGRPR